MRERLRFRGRIESAIAPRTGTRWFVALSVDVPDEIRPRKNHAVVGVDLGIETPATVADAGRQHTKEYLSPEATKELAQQRRRLARVPSRKQGPEPGKKPSANLLKASREIARLEARIANIRIDATHETTTDIVRNRDDRPRRPQRPRHDGQPQTGRLHRRRRVLRVSAADRIQGEAARDDGGARTPFLPVVQGV
jgi:transposase